MLLNAMICSYTSKDWTNSCFKCLFYRKTNGDAKKKKELLELRAQGKPNPLQEYINDANAKVRSRRATHCMSLPRTPVASCPPPHVNPRLLSCPPTPRLPVPLACSFARTSCPHPLPVPLACPVRPHTPHCD